ncbi:MAG: Transcriptional regulator, AraC family [Chthoniobacteraceae bacterium]|nr:Transcriptional regulator, AraC family [Chthoniobacteraceae bacterium]
MKTKQKNVLVALGWYDHRLLQGIAAYATQHRWHLAAHSIIHEKVIPWGWEGDGVLAWLAAGDDLAHFVASVKVPTVDFSLRRPHLPFAHVVQDHARTGQLVADHFVERGLRNFLFYSDSENWSQIERGEGFTNALAASGHKCDWLRWREDANAAQSQWTRRREWLLAHLKAGPKPVAVFAANGTLAVEVQELCEDASIRVPAEVAIVGIDDYLLSVGAANRSVSGVDTNLEEQGYQGAALLDRMMRGAKMPAKPVRIAPTGVITRKSSDILAVNHSGVARGLHFIAEHYADTISVDDVARVAGMSRRGLQQAFTEHVGCTPGDKIRQVRLDYAKRRLAETEEKIESIAQRSGYPSLNTFFVAFRKSEKTTPAEFRKVVRRAR